MMNSIDTSTISLHFLYEKGIQTTMKNLIFDIRV